MHRAAHQGARHRVEWALANGAPADARLPEPDGGGRTPLMSLLAGCGSGSGIRRYLGVLDLLLAEGARVNARDARGRTGLMYGARFGASLLLMQRLLEAGALRDVEDWQGLDARAHAEASGYEGALRLLGPASGPFGGSATVRLARAVGRGELGAVRRALDAFANPDYTEWGGLSLVALAAASGQVEIVRELLAAGAHPDGGASWGAVVRAARGHGHEEVVELLLEAGASGLHLQTTA